MRNYKFRTWDKLNKTMVTDLNWVAYITCGEISKRSKDYIIMAGTGLQDIEDKEIFEGDILIFGDIGAWFDSKVWYEDGAFFVNDDGSRRLLSNMMNDCISTKITGNIFERN